MKTITLILEGGPYDGRMIQVGYEDTPPAKVNLNMPGELVAVQETEGGFVAPEKIPVAVYRVADVTPPAKGVPLRGLTGRGIYLQQGSAFPSLTLQMWE